MRLLQYSLAILGLVSVNALGNTDLLQSVPHLRSTLKMQERPSPAPVPVKGGEDDANDRDVPTKSPVDIVVNPMLMCPQSKTCPTGQGVMHRVRGDRCVVRRKCVGPDEQELLSASGWKCGVCPRPTLM